MKIKTFFGASALAAMLIACGGGDINIDAQNNSQTTTNNTTNGGGGGSGGSDTNPCAQYSVSGAIRQGAFSGVNCNYGADFVDLTLPITVTDSPVTFSNLSNDGVHIFSGSLVVGDNFDNDADMTAAGIAEGGDGATIRIEAGATLAFRSSDDYMVINRGSQLLAEGTAEAPITITSVSDAVDNTVSAEDVSQWGGLIINGFGVTNKCAYTGTRGTDLAIEGECHVAAEGKGGSSQTHYGGNNDADSSGTLNYFIVKHTGAQVAPDNELNGISFNAVGSDTEVSYIQAYSTFDDGIEMFGGSVNIDHYVALYVRDDSIDIDEGYNGTINYALVIQSETDGQQCLESDGIGSYSAEQVDANAAKIAAGLNSAAELWNVTCIVSPVDTGTHGEGAGLRIREGHFAKVYNALVTTAYAPDQRRDRNAETGADEGDDADGNNCVRLDNDETLQGAQDDNVVITSSIIACHDLTKGDPLPDATSLLDWLNGSDNDTYQTASDGLAAGETPTTSENPSLDADDVNIAILEENSFYSLAIGDMVIDGGAATVTPQTMDDNDTRDFIGAVTSADDWTLGWTYGIHEDNRAQALWFE